MPRLIHFTADDESKMTFCGLFASEIDRFSRKSVYRLKDRATCKSCEKVREVNRG